MSTEKDPWIRTTVNRCVVMYAHPPGRDLLTSICGEHAVASNIYVDKYISANRWDYIMARWAGKTVSFTRMSIGHKELQYNIGHRASCRPCFSVGNPPQGHLSQGLGKLWGH